MLRLMMLQIKAFKAMSRLVKFGMMPRSWMSMWEHQRELERQQDEMAPRPKEDPATCLHPSFTRYGNNKGSFSRCLRCDRGTSGIQVAKDGCLPTSLIFQHPADHGRSGERQGQDFIEGHCLESDGETACPDPDGSPAGVRSGSLSSGLGQWGGRLPWMGRSDGCEGRCVADEWQVDGQDVTRVHHVPRKMLFCLEEFFNVPDLCPVHVHQLCPECTVEMLYKDGRNQTMSYGWHDSGAFYMSSPWTVRTTFKMTQPLQTTLLTNAGRKTLRHSVRQFVNLAQFEHEVLTSSSSSALTSPLDRLKHRSRVDLLETFAGRAGLSFRAKSYGLKALGPIDYNTGYDLSRSEHQSQVDHLLDSFRPMFLVQGIDCKDWCLLQDNVNYIRRKVLLLMRRVKARRLLRQVVKWCVSFFWKVRLLADCGWNR